MRIFVPTRDKQAVIELFKEHPRSIYCALAVRGGVWGYTVYEKRDFTWPQIPNVPTDAAILNFWNTTQVLFEITDR